MKNTTKMLFMRLIVNKKVTLNLVRSKSSKIILDKKEKISLEKTLQSFKKEKN
jgi:hypothetical protein